MSRPVRVLVVFVLLAGLLSSVPLAVAQTNDQPLRIDIPAGSLADSLDRLGDESGMQIMYEPPLVNGIAVAALRGTLTVGDALTQLLAHTGIRADRVNDRTVVLRRAEASRAKPSKRQRADSTPDSVSEESPQEVVVSAQKRGEERLQDTPIPIAVLSGDLLTENNQVLLRDYYTSVPGLSVTPDIEAQQEISIRGITQSGSNPTVGILIDDIPFGSSIGWAGNIVPDIDPGDLARVEVLRGPQGTLYGANSLGGLLKFVTRDPSTEDFSGRMETGTSNVYDGTAPGFNLRGSVNAPLGDSSAIRASAFTRQDPGYIDNVVQHIRGINEVQAYGARLAALWKPSTVVYLKLSALYQHTRSNGVPQIDQAVNGYTDNAAHSPPNLWPSLGDLQQNYVAGVDRSDVTVQAYAAVLKIRLGDIDLTSDTGYGVNHAISPFDFSSTFGPIFQSLGYGVYGAPLITEVNLHKVSEELRLSGGLGHGIDWLVGGFYTYENESPGFQQRIYESDATTGQRVGVFYAGNYYPTFEEYAAFGDLKFRLTDRFSVQLGARESRNHQTFRSVTTGPFVAVVDQATAPLISSGAADGDSFTYLLTPQLDVSADLMVYMRLASGYRPGGPNNVPTTNLPASFAPDKTYNYEVGLKGTFLDDRLSVDASVYHIDWKDLQLSLQQIYSYNANGGGAKSDGIELSIESKPLTGLTLGGWVSYDNAVLTTDFPAASTAYGVSGERLPATPKFSANLSFEQHFSVADRLDVFLGATGNYIGARLGLFSGTPERETYPAYTRTDVHAGFRYDAWKARIYANNVADIRGITSGGLGYYAPWAFTVIQPRTVGVSLSKTF